MVDDPSAQRIGGQPCAAALVRVGWSGLQLSGIVGRCPHYVGHLSSPKMLGNSIKGGSHERQRSRQGVQTEGRPRDGGGQTRHRPSLRYVRSKTDDAGDRLVPESVGPRMIVKRVCGMNGLWTCG
ncbi:MAG: hypothetical protein QOC62_5439 [Mycobacterium sp.]|jgi:hypothetical protein|nr:hypothetical protein [Mycobacterium sp.]